MIKMSNTFEWNGDEAKIAGYNTVNKSALEIGIITQGQAVYLSPYALGRLRKSIVLKTKDDTIYNQYGPPEKPEDEISAASEDGEVKVGTNVDYSWHQEFGTAKMQAQPYLRPAFDMAVGQSVTVMEKNGKIEFKDYLRQE